MQFPSLEEVATLEQTEDVATGAVIFLHGTGENGQDTRDLMKQILEDETIQLKGHRYVKMYFPTAPQMYLRFRDQVTTCWFDSQRTGSNLEDIDCNLEDTDNSADYILEHVKKIEATGIPRSRIVLAGISQGAMVAQYVAYTKLKEFAGVICLASIFPFTKAKMLPPPHPELHYLYGSRDPIIPMRGIRMAEYFLKLHGVNFNLRVLPNSTHKIDISYVRVFLHLLTKMIPDRSV